MNVSRNKIENEPNSHYGMVIDGHCLGLALSRHRILLSDVTKLCQAVVCCRMSPIQKAEVL